MIKPDCLTPQDLYIKYMYTPSGAQLGTFKISERNKGTIRQYQRMQQVLKQVYHECQGLHPCYILVIVFTLFKKFHKIMCFASGLSYLSTLC